MPETQLVETNVHEQVATLRLNRPEAGNALSAALVTQLHGELDAVDGRDDVRAIILCGAGRGFSAGADVNELAQAPVEMLAEGESTLIQVAQRLAAARCPVIAAVHGYAVGGGFLLALYCDFRMAATETRIGFPKLSRAWLPACGLARLAELMGPLRAQQFVLLPGPIGADEALKRGLVDRVVEPDDLPLEAMALARQLAQSSPRLVEETRRFFAAWRGRDYDHWDQLAVTGFARAFAGAEARQALEGLRQSLDRTRQGESR